jgi:hypothetical protein
MATPRQSPSIAPEQPTVAQQPQTPSGSTSPDAPPVPAVPPVPPQQAAQVVQMLIQAGVMPGTAPNPETVKHLTDFLKHDSDNRLTSSDKEGSRKLRLRMVALIISGVLALLLLSIPVIALFQGQREFVASFLDHHMAYLIALAAAFIGGIGVKNIFK